MIRLPDQSRVAVLLTVPATGLQLTFPYPKGTGPGSFGVNGDHKVVAPDFTELVSRLGHIKVEFLPVATGIRVTNQTDRAFKAGNHVTLVLDLAGLDDSYDTANAAAGVYNLFPLAIALGVVATADADGAVASQSATAANGLATGINGALAAGGVATFDVPRNVVAAWTGTAVLTVTGTDVDGNPVSESSASGTSFTGKKAFKTVTGVKVSANVTALTVGSGAVLGIPLFIGAAHEITAEYVDGSAPGTAGTFAVGDTAAPTATTGDPRGTYTPNSAPNSSRSYVLHVLAKSKGAAGRPQFVAA